MLLQQYEVVRKSRDRNLWKKDWMRLHAFAGVQKVSVVDHGIHVETNSLIVACDSVKYRIGSFIIRYCHDGIFVWSQNSLHKQGIAHPHISESGVVCFGNVGSAITTAAIESRVVDAVELVLRWLTDGYDPELAETKITEWPREEESI